MQFGNYGYSNYSDLLSANFCRAHALASATVFNSSCNCLSRISLSNAPIAGPGRIPILIKSPPFNSGGRISGCLSSSFACSTRKS